jgi:DNA-binding MarR family transcriptional regulator
MSPSHSPQELAAKEAACRELINERLVLTLRERGILNVIITWSLARGREWAVFESIGDLGKLSGLDRPHASATLFSLEEKKLLQRIARHRQIKLRFLPTGGELIEPPMRVDPIELTALISKMDALNEVPEGFEFGGQKLLTIETVDERMADDAAGMSYERGLEMLRKFRESGGDPEASRTESVRGDRDLPYQIGTEEPQRTESVRREAAPAYRIGTAESADTAARARTRARHDHVCNEEPTALMTHDHERGAADKKANANRSSTGEFFLSGEIAFELMERIEQLVAPAVLTDSYRAVWTKRICLNMTQVHEALGDAANAKREGKIKSSVGGVLNAAFLDITGEKKRKAFGGAPR